MSRIPPFPSKWFRKLFPRLWAYFRFFGNYISMMSRFESTKDSAVAAKASADFVRQTLETAEVVLQSRPWAKLGGMLKSFRLLLTIWQLNAFVVMCIFIAHRDGAQLNQDDFRRLIRLAQAILELHELRAKSVRRYRFARSRFSILRRYERIRQAQDVGSNALPHIVLAVAYTRLGAGDLNQNLRTAFNHFEIASEILTQVNLQALRIMAAGVLAALGNAYLNYPTENRALYARRAIDALSRAKGCASEDIVPGLEAARQGKWKEVFSRKASRMQIAKHVWRLASAPSVATESGKPLDPVLTVLFAPAYLAWVDWKLGVAHKELGELDDALARLDSALQTLELLRTYEEANSPTIRNMRATILVSKGSVYLEKWSRNRREDIHLEVANFSEAIKLAAKLPAERWGLNTYGLSLIADARAYLALEEAGRVTRDRQNKLRAVVIKELRTAARVARKAGVFQMCQEALVLLGKVYLLQGDKARAWRSFVLASRLIDRMQRRSRSYRLSRYWASAAADLYELLIRTVLEYAPAKASPSRTSDPHRIVLGSAFSHLERGRTLFLHRELANREPLPKGARRGHPLLNKFFSLRREWLEAELRSLDEEKTPQVPFEAKLLGFRDRLSAIERRYLQELDEVRQEFGDSDYDPDRLPSPIEQRQLSDIVKRLSRTMETALVEYYISDRYLIVSVILPGLSVLKHAGISRVELEDIETRWRERYKEVTSAKISFAHWEGSLQQTLGRLRPAVERAIESIAEWEAAAQRRVKRIIIIPHRFLHLIPLHAIAVPNGGTWGDTVRIQYAPSASVLLQLMDLRLARRKKALEERSRQAAVVAVAYGSPKSRLLFHEEEVRAVAETAARGEIISGNGATPERVKDAIRDADYIHFACHGEFDDVDPFNGGLFLAPGADEITCSGTSAGDGRGASAENGQMYGVRMPLGEIFQAVQLSRARLVVLSACETGMTKVERRHEEYIGLPAGFLHAGATTVVSSLWRVEDIATWLLMRSFARRVASGSSSAEALQASQRELRALSRDAVLQEIAIAAQKEPDVARRERMLERGQGLQGEFPFISPYWWAGFTVNGLGDGVMHRAEFPPQLDARD